MRDLSVIALAMVAFVAYLVFYLAALAGTVWVIVWALRETGVLSA